LQTREDWERFRSNRRWRILKGLDPREGTTLKSIRKAAFAALIAGSAVAVCTIASADVVCTRDGDCWHVSQRYTTYPETLGVTFYNDDWRAEHMHDTHYHWYDRDDDHGFYIHGEWHAFDKDHDGD